MFRKVVSAVACGFATLTLARAEPAASSAPPAVERAGPAAYTNATTLTLNHDALDIGKPELEPGFGKGTSEAGLAVGVGIGSKVLGTTDVHDFALSKLYFGQVISDVVARDDWYRGNWELVGEVFAGSQFEPGCAYLAGVTPVLRYDFATGRRWTPFFDAGAGVTATDIGRPDLSGTFQFNLQTGPGLHCLICRNTVLTLQYRFLHISNAGIEDPNHGVNCSVFYAGVSRLF